MNSLLKIEFNFNTPKMDFKVKGYVRKRVRELCYKSLLDFFLERGSVPRYRDEVTIEYTRYSVIPMDEDGVGTTAKYWLDALTKIGVIKDDKPVSAGGHIVFVPKSGKGKPKTIIEILNK